MSLKSMLIRLPVDERDSTGGEVGRGDRAVRPVVRPRVVRKMNGGLAADPCLGRRDRAVAVVLAQKNALRGDEDSRASAAVADRRAALGAPRVGGRGAAAACAGRGSRRRRRAVVGSDARIREIAGVVRSSLAARSSDPAASRSTARAPRVRARRVSWYRASWLRAPASRETHETGQGRAGPEPRAHGGVAREHDSPWHRGYRCGHAIFAVECLELRETAQRRWLQAAWHLSSRTSR